MEENGIPESSKSSGLNLAEIREKIEQEPDRQFTSLGEVAETPAAVEFIHREFHREAAPWMADFDRRTFLKVMGASAALAGLAACRPKIHEKIVPYVKSPEEVVPGEPLQYATTVNFAGYGFGALATAYDGRPTKLDGNDLHPATMGASDIYLQASILDLYDPNRGESVIHRGAISTRDEFFGSARTMLRAATNQGSGVRFLIEPTTSPTFKAQWEALKAKLPKAKLHVWDPINFDNARAAAVAAFGKPVDAVYDFTQAKVIVSLDSDFVNEGPQRIRAMRDYSAMRRVSDENSEMSRHYQFESTPTITGTTADHRAGVAASDMLAVAKALAAALGVIGGASPVTGKAGTMVEAAAADLAANQSAGLVIVGPGQPPAVHVLAHAINNALGNVGKTVRYVESPEVEPVVYLDSLRELIEDMKNGEVEALFVIGANPVFTAPSDFGFAELYRTKVPFTAHLGLYETETGVLSMWHLPRAHDLEEWSDSRAFDGTASIVQPLIEPLHDGMSVHTFMAGLIEDNRAPLDIVRSTWQSAAPDEKSWRRLLHEGVIPGTEQPSEALIFNQAALDMLDDPSMSLQPRGEGIEVLFRPDPTIHDGRFANNSWLQELPKPLTKITWDNVVYVSPKMAQEMGIDQETEEGDIGGDYRVPMVEITVGKNKIQAPAWILPGQPDRTVTVLLGYGRTQAGSVGNGVGTNTYGIRTSDSMWTAVASDIAKTGQRYELATTQHHYRMEGRHLVRSSSLEGFKANPHFATEYDHISLPESAKREGGEHDEDVRVSMYPEREWKGHAWGMVIDTTTCTGCNACVVACQAENNIPTVGKEDIKRGREMHWIRIDRYYEGDLDDPETHLMPVNCMHCEQAPCEVVCPVAATSHSVEGLNEMIYNRCVGTRYCSNNCPYKVRRFNYFQFSDITSPLLRLKNNPNVTVRGRGVMEKCTYCVQRINAARQKAKAENRPIREGEVLTACQTACPAQAITFGDIHNAESQVVKVKKQPHNYSLLKELNTIPRTTYLAKLRNPNPALENA